MPTFTFDPNTGQTVVKDTRTEAQKKADEAEAKRNREEKYIIGIHNMLDLAVNSGAKPLVDKTKKKLANFEWYRKHKSEKQKYNKQYYLDNIEYWRNYYLMRKNEGDYSRKHGNDVHTDKNEGRISGNVWHQKNAQVHDALKDAAAINLKRAERDYLNYLENTKKLPFKDAWKSGAEQIKNTGSAFLNKVLRKDVNR